MLIKGLQKLTLLDFPGRIACTVFLGGCNMRCPFCHNGSLVLGGGEEISEDELLAFLESRRGRLSGVCVSGGEPTLHPDLPDLVKKIKDLGFEVKLDTNGTNPKMLSRLISDGLVDYVAMDIKNSPEKYAVTAGLDDECSVSRQNRLISDFDVANAQKQEAMGSESTEESGSTIIRECGQASDNNDTADGSIPAENLPIMEKIKHSCDILLQNLVDFEFRTTLIRELHSEEDIRAIGKWLSGKEKYFLQTYRDEGDLLVGGFTSYTPEQTRDLLSVLREYIPNAEIRS